MEGTAGRGFEQVNAWAHLSGLKHICLDMVVRIWTLIKRAASVPLRQKALGVSYITSGMTVSLVVKW